MLMRHSKNKKWIAIVLGVALVFGIVIWANDHEKMSSDGTAFDTSKWQTYESDEFNFEIKYPVAWSVAESDDLVPMITFYKAGQTGAPFDHFANATHVSVYPNGIPTEGVISERQEAVIEVRPEINKANDLLTDAGNVFASYYTFSEAPETWEPWGFLWARNKMEGESLENPRDRALIEAILQTFKFTN